MATVSLEHFLGTRLTELKDRGLYGTIDILEGANGPLITIQGRELINLASNNYLGFATKEELKEAEKRAVDKYGVGAGAVRTISGTLLIHRELEEKLAAFKGTEAAIAFQSGFNCNMGVISALMNKEDAILSDELNHASIIDGCRLSGAKIIRVKHQDMSDLEQKAREAVESGLYQKVMYITDGVFSMDGDVAKIPEIVEVAKRWNLITYVDDAHGSGVMGHGAGTVKHFNMQEHIDIQMGTLSKGIGVVGGYVAGTQQLIDYLKSQARPFLFSTSLTPGAAGAIIQSLTMMQEQPEHVETLWRNARYFKNALKQIGYDIGQSETPITPVILGDERTTQEFSQRLMEQGVYVKAIVYPTVPMGSGRVRNMPTAAHTKEMLDQAVGIYEMVGKDMGII